MQSHTNTRKMCPHPRCNCCCVPRCSLGGLKGFKGSQDGDGSVVVERMHLVQAGTVMEINARVREEGSNAADAGAKTETARWPPSLRMKRASWLVLLRDVPSVLASDRQAACTHLSRRRLGCVGRCWEHACGQRRVSLAARQHPPPLVGMPPREASLVVAMSATCGPRAR